MLCIAKITQTSRTNQACIKHALSTQRLQWLVLIGIVIKKQLTVNTYNLRKGKDSVPFNF